MGNDCLHSEVAVVSVSVTPFFAHKHIHKTTWTSPDGTAKNEIDYICISTRWGSFRMCVHWGDWCWLRPPPADSKDPLEAKEEDGSTAITTVYAAEGFRDAGTSKRYSDEVINRFLLLQDEHDLQKQRSLFTQAVNESAECWWRTWQENIIESNKRRWISAKSWQLTDEHKSAKAKRDQATQDGADVKETNQRIIQTSCQRSEEELQNRQEAVVRR